MRKMNLIAAAGLALLAGAAQAQVTLYGNLDVSLAHTKADTPNFPLLDGSTTSVNSNNLVDSYIGFKGNEDLGGGLKALFTLESALNVDTGEQQQDNFWGRNAYVGLAGAFGTVKAGNQESLFKTEGAAFNPFGASALFSTTNLALDFGGLGGSWQNTVGYTSPNLSGLTLSGQYSAKEGAKSTSSSYGGGAYVLAANYAAGPFAVSALYGDVKTTDSTDTNVKQQAYLLGGSYDFGVAKAFAQYGRDKFKLKNVDGDDTVKFYQIGASVPVTDAGAVLASYGQLKGEDGKNQQFSLAYNHSLSKRTGVYAGVTFIKNKADANSEADKWTTFAVGVRHAF